MVAASPGAVGDEIGMVTEAGGPPALSPRQQTAVTNLQRHWRGLSRRLHVLRKWSWAVSNGLENREEQRMVELGMFVESIAEELAMDRAGAPSLERRNTVGHKSLLAGGLKSLVSGLKSTEPQASGSVKSEPPEPKCDGPAPLLPPAPCCPPQEIGVTRAMQERSMSPTNPPPPCPRRPFTLRFPLREADVLEMVAGFSRGQQLSRGSVEQLLDLHVEVLQPLPNASAASCKPSGPSSHSGSHHALLCAAMGRRGLLPASLKGPTRLPSRSYHTVAPLGASGHGRHGRQGRHGRPVEARLRASLQPARPKLTSPPLRPPRWSASTCLLGRSSASSATCMASSRCPSPASSLLTYYYSLPDAHLHLQPLTHYSLTHYQDLMHIFRTHGFPSADRPFLFNGDFVDRGTQSVEVLLTLYAWQQLLPGSVMLNRGNHEERSVNVRNGFENECAQKYDGDMHDRFVATFAWLPLGTIVNGKVSHATSSTLSAAPRCLVPQLTLT